MKIRLILCPIWLLCLIAAVMSLVWQLTAILFSPARAWKIAIGYDQLANATWGNDPDETISSLATKSARKRRAWWAIALCWVLEKLDPGHCGRAIETDRGEIV